MTKTIEIEFLSLFDYRGYKAAGPELGAAVYEDAKKRGVLMRTREVSNSKYTGKIMLYPKPYLDNYFGGKL